MCGSIVLLFLPTHQPQGTPSPSNPLPNMLYKAACLICANAKAVLHKIIDSGEAEGKAKAMFVKNMVCFGIQRQCCVMIRFQRKYKQIVGLMEEEGWIPRVDWTDDDTESVLEWKEPNGMGDESSNELSEDEASDTKDLSK
jgi:hypothetical protein